MANPNYDLTKLAVEMNAPSNVLIYDDLGDPSVMVAVPKFKMSDVLAGGSDSTHPAFIINGVEQDVIYVSKFENIVNNGRAYSLPRQDPAVNVNHDQAWQYCKAKGVGWHLLTNAEWAALALWCKKNGTMPLGNNNYGKDVSETVYKALPSTARDSSGRVQRVATGTGPLTWSHDGTPGGIFGLNGNVWGWTTGLRLQNGEIQIIPNNDAADWNNPVTAASTLWKAIMPDGTLVAPGTAGTLKWDYLNSKITLSTTNTVGDTQRSTAFESLAVDASVSAVPEILKSLALHPAETGYQSDNVWATLSSERLPIRGGRWAHGALAGVFALDLSNSRSHVGSSFGFRSAFYGNP
jgi:hypothetical protein